MSSEEKLRLIRTFNSPKHDIWTSIKFIYENETPGVVDFIVHRLFSFPEEEVEFYIPQLCNLLIHRPMLQSLEEFILIRCSVSIHFAIKVYLYLHANSNEFSHLKLNRALKLLNSTETVAINGESSSIAYTSPFVYFPKQDDSETANIHFSMSSRRTRVQSEAFEKSRSLPSTPISFGEHQSPVFREFEIENTPNSQATNKQVKSTTPVVDSPKPKNERRMSTALGAEVIQGQSANVDPLMNPESEDTALAPLKQPTRAMSLKDANLTFSRSSSIGLNPRMTLQTELSMNKFNFYKSKGYRSEYFTSVDAFLTSLTRVSENLRSVPIEQRNDELCRQLNKLNDELPNALYVPLGKGSDYHHAVLRIPAEEAFTLRSKERVPFMLYYEVMEFNKKCSNPELTLPVIETRSRPLNKVEKVVDGAFGELMKNKEKRLKQTSVYGHIPTWKLFSCIVKSGDDLRQDQLAIQLIEQFQKIFKDANLPLYLYSYRVLVTSCSSGYIEVVPNATSLDTLKRKTPEFTTLANYFTKTYSSGHAISLEKARNNFIESMAAYSLVSYFLQIKDRHNGNILITDEGHIIHIDFGFFLSNSPGAINFESAPFKLTLELAEVMGGYRSTDFERFRALFVAGFMEARRNADKLLFLVDMARSLSQLPCFKLGKATVDNMATRFCMSMDNKEAERFARNLVDSAHNAWSTRQYDNFQYFTNGIL